MITIFETFYANADQEKAAQMSAYMRNQFPFCGIPTPLRRKLSAPFLAEISKTHVNWEYVFKLWKQPEREFQYFACAVLKKAKSALTPKDIPNLRKLAVTKSWWDTIDGLDLIIGDLALCHSEVNKTLLKWSEDKNIWLRRIAIDHQLLRKNQTNIALLKQILINNFGQTEFFINKAIGWSLREYSKTNPAWVQEFIGRYRGQMSALSVREASKYI